MRIDPILDRQSTHACSRRCWVRGSINSLDWTLCRVPRLAGGACSSRARLEHSASGPAPTTSCSSTFSCRRSIPAEKGGAARGSCPRAEASSLERSRARRPVDTVDAPVATCWASGPPAHLFPLGCPGDAAPPSGPGIWASAIPSCYLARKPREGAAGPGSASTKGWTPRSLGLGGRTGPLRLQKRQIPGDTSNEHCCPWHGQQSEGMCSNVDDKMPASPDDPCRSAH